MESPATFSQVHWDEIWSTLQRRPYSEKPPALSREDLWDEERWRELVPLIVRDLIRGSRSGNLEEEAENLILLGFLLGKLELYNESCIAQRRGLFLYRELGELTDIASALSCLAWQLASSSNPEEGIPIYREAIKAHVELQEFDDVFFDLANLGALLGRLGHWQDALACFDDALPIAPDRTSGWRRTSILEAIAKVHQDLGDLVRAIWFQQEAVNNLLQAGEEAAAAEQTVRLGELHALAGLPADGRALIMNAIMVLEALGEGKKAAWAACAMWDMD